MSQQPKIIIPTSSIKNVEVEHSKEMQSAADCKGMGHQGNQCSCVCHNPNQLIIHDRACCIICSSCGFKTSIKDLL